MKKFWAVFLAGILLIPLLFQSQAQAAVNISVIIDGARLSTSQSPIMIQGRVMVPMRAIFEALDAKVTWNQKAQTVTAVKNNTTIILKINAKTATINRQTVTLDVPAKNLSGTTMVPTRFVSEALGEKVGWNSKTKTVTINTSNGGTAPDVSLAPVTYVTARDIGNNGDGRDLQVSFSRSGNEHLASQYRVMLVKAAKSSSFTSTAAYQVSPSNYSVIFPNGSDPSVTLNSGSRDTDGELIRENQAYVAYVLTIGRNSSEYLLSAPAQAVTLVNTQAVNAASNVKGSDVSDYGDGRDVSISFTRAGSENQISNYRVYAVKTKDAGSFNLASTKNVPSQNYTTVSKTSTSSSTLTTSLSSSARDTSGELIRNGTAYTFFVLSVSANENSHASKLSSASASLTLGTGSSGAPVITQVSDISDYGDGRDLRVSFTKLSDESSISSYRIFVVKSGDAGSFNLSKANNVSSSNYTQISKNGSNRVQALSSGSRDIDGQYIRTGVNYRVFVMAIRSNSNSGSNLLSSPSSDIVLYNNTNVDTVTNISIKDIGDNNDGRDLQVYFDHARDESNISHYRIFVVKNSRYSSFDRNDANNLSNSYYTQVSKTGNNITKALSSGTRDTDGDYIRSGVSYRVFVLSVASSGSSSSNALSSPSSSFTLNINQISPASNLAVSDIGDHKDGRDLRVTFNRSSNEGYVDHYRVLVVKAGNAGSFNLSKANGSDFTRVNKTGGNLSVTLRDDTRDVDGDRIKNDTAYRVFVLTVANNSYYSDNVLSSASSSITLTTKVSPVAAVTDVKAVDERNSGNGSDLIVSFKKASDEKNIKEYRVYVVPADKADGFNASEAIKATHARKFDAGDNVQDNLGENSKDSVGSPIKNMVPYKVFVLSVSADGNASNHTLSKSTDITLRGEPVTAPQSVTAKVYETEKDGPAGIEVTFERSSNDKNLLEYRVMIVPAKQPFGDLEASKVKEGNYQSLSKSENPKVKFEVEKSKDVTGQNLKTGQSYKAVVLAVGDPKITDVNVLSEVSDSVAITSASKTDPQEATEINASLDKEDPSQLLVKFKKAVKEENISAYHIGILPSETSSLETAVAGKALSFSAVTLLETEKPDGKDQEIKIKVPDRDLLGKDIEPGKEYKVIVISQLKGAKGSRLFSFKDLIVSEPSKPLVLKAAPKESDKK